MTAEMIAWMEQLTEEERAVVLADLERLLGENDDTHGYARTVPDLVQPTIPFGLRGISAIWSGCCQPYNPAVTGWPGSS